MPRETNEEFLIKLMNFSKCGGLMQLFVIEAITKYSELCIEAGADTFDSDLLQGEAWVACAREAKEKIDKAYSALRAEVEIGP